MLSKRFEEALTYAADLHQEQMRKGSGIPYISHLLAVCALVLEYGGSEDEAIAALLHDAVEDQGGQSTLEEIRQRFGENVAAIVEACSDTDVVPKPPWRARKEAYLKHLETAPSSVILVSAADKLHNARSILTDYRQQGEALWSRFNVGRDGQIWYYQQLTSVFRQRRMHQALVEELARTVAAIVAETGIEVGIAEESA
ncbi:MAG TPA: HD domain-containing protein [Gammaproteobacteria bacterium]|nr:HD domain-containing protein [Gammaproteobacteria bacterium]